MGRGFPACPIDSRKLAGVQTEKDGNNYHFLRNFQQELGTLYKFTEHEEDKWVPLWALVGLKGPTPYAFQKRMLSSLMRLST
jgi:hypothetical protein